jgi:hypothetical protein
VIFARSKPQNRYSLTQYQRIELAVQKLINKPPEVVVFRAAAGRFSKFSEVVKPLAKRHFESAIQKHDLTREVQSNNAKRD